MRLYTGNQNWVVKHRKVKFREILYMQQLGVIKENRLRGYNRKLVMIIF